MTELILKEECHQIIGCAMTVLNSIGHGFYEKIYENALVVEFGFNTYPQANNLNIQWCTNRL